MTPELEGKNGLEIASLWFHGRTQEAIAMASLEPWLTAEGALAIYQQGKEVEEVREFLAQVVHAGRMI
jgi:hypothetical protein